jgi:outer membrane protein
VAFYLKQDKRHFSMKKVSAFAFSTFLLLVLEGCYVNKAVVSPWSYGPPSSSDYWTPPKKTKNIKQIDPELPSTENPLSLAELLDIALINNTQTKQTWAEARSAAATYGQTQSSAFPSIQGNYNYARTRVSSFFSDTQNTTTTSGAVEIPAASSQPEVFISLYNQWGPQFSLSYTIFDFGQQRATTESARQALYYSDYTHNRAIETVIQTTTNDYYGYLYQNMLLEAAQADVETAQTTMEAALLSVETGVQDISDLLQAKTKLLQAELHFIEEQQHVHDAFATLLNNMGLPANMEFTVIPMPTDIPPEEQFPDADILIQVALDNRPDFLASIAEVKSKQQSVIAAKREVWPSINYNLNAGKTFYPGGVNDKYDYTSTISASIPLFSGYYYRNNIKIAQANQEDAEASMKQLELEVIKDVTTSRYNVIIAYEAMKYAKSYLACAKEQYAVALAQYKTGTNTILDVISAQSYLADARARQANAIASWYEDLSNLAYAVGITSKQPFNLKEPS